MSLFQRLRDVLGLNEEYDDYYYPEESNPDPYTEEGSSPRRKTLPNNVIGLPGVMMEVVLMQPRSFEEIPEAVTALRERKAIILNLNAMEVELAQRCADYVAGGAFAIDGHQKQLGENIFLFTPSFVQITDHPLADLAKAHQATAAKSFTSPPSSVWEPPYSETSQEF